MIEILGLHDASMGAIHEIIPLIDP